MRNTLRRVRAGKLRGAFTLVELLVVIGIIAVLIGVLLPVLGRAREQANRTRCLSNLRQLGQAMLMYANTYQDRLPNGNPPQTTSDYDATNSVLVALNRDYIRAANVFWCPSDVDPAPEQIETADYALPNSARVSYEFYSPFWIPEYGPKLTKIKMAPIAWDLNGAAPVTKDQNHSTKGGNVVYADGHADWQLAQEWDDGNWPHPAAKYYKTGP